MYLTLGCSYFFYRVILKISKLYWIKKVGLIFLTLFINLAIFLFAQCKKCVKCTIMIKYKMWCHSQALHCIILRTANNKILACIIEGPLYFFRDSWMGIFTLREEWMRIYFFRDSWLLLYFHMICELTTFAGIIFYFFWDFSIL